MADGQILYAKSGNTCVLKFIGEIRYTICAPLSSFITELDDSDSYDDILIDLTETESIDSTNLGLLARIANLMQARFQRKGTMVSSNENVNRTLETVGFFEIFTIDSGHHDLLGDLQSLSADDTDSAQLAQTILQAHQTLSKLNESNREMFRSVVEGLEAELGTTPAAH